LNYSIAIFFFIFFGLNVLFAQQDSFLAPVDIPPLFEGCDDPLISKQQRQICSNPKIQAFVKQNIIYPDSARLNNIEGIVVVRFSVSAEGKITDIEIVRDIGAGCGKEAVRVVRIFPDFTPALRNGVPVPAKITLPIRFKKIEEAEANNKNLYQIHWGTAYSSSLTKTQLKELLNYPLVIRDYYGNLYEIVYFTLKIKTQRIVNEFENKGNYLSIQMVKGLKKTRPKHNIIFIATIIKDFQEIKIFRKLELR
jgi:TonB family protein